MLTTEQRIAMAQALYAAEVNHVPIEPFTVTHPDADCNFSACRHEPTVSGS